MSLLPQVIPYSQDDVVRWDTFVQKSMNGTLFHERRFLSYHPEGRFTEHSLTLSDNTSWLALLPAALVQTTSGLTLTSHPGASFGGFIYPHITLQKVCLWVESLVQYAKHAGLKAIRMTLPPAVYARQVSDYQEFALLQMGFCYDKRELTAVVPLLDKQTERWKPEARTALRKAEKSRVSIVESEDMESFYHLLWNNLQHRHGVKPTHTLEELQRLRTLYPQRIALHSAYLDKTMIAGVVSFVASTTTALGFYIADDKHYQNFRPLNLLFSRIFDWAYQKQLCWYDFGTFTLNMTPNAGLARFKESFGAQGLFRSTLKLEL